MMFVFIKGIDEGAEQCKIIKAKSEKEALHKFAEWVKGEREFEEDTVKQIKKDSPGKLFGASKNQIAFMPGDGDSEDWFALFKMG